ncbi:g9924 [Coccomyxa elongata]
MCGCRQATTAVQEPKCSRQNSPEGHETEAAPELTGGGGGIGFWWEAGVVKYLQQRYPSSMANWQMRGASAGALTATLAACKVDMDRAYESAKRLAEEHELFERALGLTESRYVLAMQAMLAALVLEAWVPFGAESRGRLKIAVRDVHTFKLVLIDDFATKSELIDANMASAHIPFFLDWRPFAVYRYHDDKLKMGRFDFVKLKDPNEVRRMIASGFEYAQRMDAAGALKPHFGSGP